MVKALPVATEATPRNIGGDRFGELRSGQSRPRNPTVKFREIGSKWSDPVPTGGNSWKSGIPKSVLRPLEIRGRPRRPPPCGKSAAQVSLANERVHLTGVPNH